MLSPSRSLLSARHFYIALTLSLVVAGLFIARYQYYPSVTGRADAWAYQFYAFRFREYGILHDFGTVRTYGYPLFLYPLTYISGYDNNRLSLVAGIVQFSLFFLTTLWLSRLTANISRRLSFAVLVGLLLNPLVISLVTDALTEGLSVSLYVMLAALVVKFGQSKEGARLGVLILGAFVTAIALMVRPASIAVVIAWYFAIAAVVIWESRTLRERALVCGTALLSMVVAGGVVWGPQLIYNFQLYNKATFLPVCQLGDFQAAFSVIAWKYDTTVTGELAGPWNYLNPLFNGHLAAEGGWKWYFENPVAGILTLGAHIFNAFSVTSPFTYIRDLNPLYGLPLRVLYWTLTIVGAAGLLRHALTLANPKYRELRTSNILALSFIGFSLFFIVALNSITAVEVRFNVVPIAMLSVFAVERFLAYISGTVVLRRSGAIAYVVLILACLGGSYAMDLLGTAGMEGRTFDFDIVKNQCFLVAGDTGANRVAIINEFEDLMRIRRAEETAN
ncbi:hypothetical protein [Microvirga sp. P5_D2]